MDNGENLAALIMDTDQTPTPCKNPVDGAARAYQRTGLREYSTMDTVCNVASQEALYAESRALLLLEPPWAQRDARMDTEDRIQGL